MKFLFYRLSLKWRRSCGLVLPATSAHLKKGWVPGLAAVRSTFDPVGALAERMFFFQTRRKRFYFVFWMQQTRGLFFPKLENPWSVLVDRRKHK